MLFHVSSSEIVFGNQVCYCGPVVGLMIVQTACGTSVVLVHHVISKQQAGLLN